MVLDDAPPDVDVDAVDVGTLELIEVADDLVLVLDHALVVDPIQVHHHVHYIIKDNTNRVHQSR